MNAYPSMFATGVSWKLLAAVALVVVLVLIALAVDSHRHDRRHEPRGPVDVEPTLVYVSTSREHAEAEFDRDKTAAAAGVWSLPSEWTLGHRLGPAIIDEVHQWWPDGRRESTFVEIPAGNPAVDPDWFRSEVTRSYLNADRPMTTAERADFLARLREVMDPPQIPCTSPAMALFGLDVDRPAGVPS